MNETMICRDFWIRYTSAEGRTHVVQHRVWDGDRLIARAQRDAVQANAKAKRDDADAPAFAKAEAITFDQYRAEGGR